MDNIIPAPYINASYNDGEHKYAGFFINKDTDYYYSGSNLTFSLSHALFSSFEIDSGSRLLLKSLSSLIKEKPPLTILDAGCGTGILSAALKKGLEDAEIYLYDRDSMAVYFSELNLIKNGINIFNTANSLLMFPFKDKKFDLIVSNLPAKAGKEVLSDFILQSPYHLKKNGTAAVVIVKPLSDFAEETLKNGGLEICLKVKTANYTVFHFKAPEKSLISTESKIKPENILFETYIRNKNLLFNIKGNKQNIDTATGLPDFDNLSFNTKLAGELILSLKDKIKTDKKQLIINPGQGLIPLFMRSNTESSEIMLTVSSNDLLQLKMTERNLRTYSSEKNTDFMISPTVFHTIDSFENGTLDTIVYFYSSVPGFKKQDLIIHKLNQLLKKDGKLILTSTASEISRFLSSCRGFANVKGKKNKGIRSVYLKKTADI